MFTDILGEIAPHQIQKWNFPIILDLHCFVRRHLRLLMQRWNQILKKKNGFWKNKIFEKNEKKIWENVLKKNDIYIIHFSFNFYLFVVPLPPPFFFCFFSFLYPTHYSFFPFSVYFHSHPFLFPLLLFHLRLPSPPFPFGITFQIVLEYWRGKTCFDERNKIIKEFKNKNI